MKRDASMVWVAILAGLATPAVACPLAEAEGPNRLRLQPPMTSEIFTGFGMRPHPILVIPKFHTGVDYAANVGDSVRAAAAGKVTMAGPNGAYGNAVTIQHGNGFETAYGHLHRIGVKEGDCVEGGAIIGKAGSTGLVAGPQLHFEVRQGGEPLDPAVMLARP